MENQTNCNYHIVVRRLANNNGKIDRVEIHNAQKYPLDDIKHRVGEYNRCNNPYKYELLDVPNEKVEEVIAWLVNDRELDINRHIDELREVQDRLGSIESDIDYEVKMILDAIRYRNNQDD